MMVDALSRLTFRSAAPFAYLLFLIVCTASFAVGLFLIISCRRAGRRSLPGVVLIAVPCLWVIISLLGEGAVELNPVVDADEIVGTWEDGERVLILSADGTYVFGGPGTWSLDDWNLKLSNTGTWRVIRAGNDLRILSRMPDDPDMWDGDLEFQRVARARMPEPVSAALVLSDRDTALMLRTLEARSALFREAHDSITVDMTPGQVIGILESTPYRSWYSDSIVSIYGPSARTTGDTREPSPSFNFSSDGNYLWVYTPLGEGRYQSRRIEAAELEQQLHELLANGHLLVDLATVREPCRWESLQYEIHFDRQSRVRKISAIGKYVGLEALWM